VLRIGARVRNKTLAKEGLDEGLKSERLTIVREVG
jgi:hypothetical protein